MQEAITATLAPMLGGVSGRFWMLGVGFTYLVHMTRSAVPSGEELEVVKRMMMQIQDTAAAVPTKSHSQIFWGKPGFKMRVNMEVTANFGVGNDIMPNRKLTVLRRMASSQSFC